MGSIGFADLCGPVAWRPVAMGVALMVIQQWSGVNAVLFNINQLVDKVGGVGFAGIQVFCTLIASLVRGCGCATLTHCVFACGLVSCKFMFLAPSVCSVFCPDQVMEKAGRRFFLAFSAFGMCLAAIAFGYSLQENYASSAKISCAMVYIAVFSFGLGPIPWLVCAELYPARVRTLAVSLVRGLSITFDFCTL